MNMTQVWIPDQTTSEHRGFLPLGAEVHDYSLDEPLPERLGRGDFLINTFYPARALSVMRRIDGLRIVQMFAAGVDAIAPEIPPSITLCDGSGIHDAPVAEWVVMVTLAMQRSLPRHVLAQRDSTRASGSGVDLDGTKVLIVGFGSIGRAVEARLAPFGVALTRVARHHRDGVHTVNELPELLRAADVVVILVPLTDQTRGLVDASFINFMRPGALLVNAARGPVVDTLALIEALRRGRIRAALDVTDPEPLPDGHPLWRAPGVLITPHIAGAVSRVLDRAWRFAGDQVQRFIDGVPLRNIVKDGY